MAITVSKHHSNSSFNFLLFIVVFSLLTSNFVLVFSFSRERRYKREYKIDKQDFKDSVIYALTNNLITSESTNSVSSVISSVEVVRFNGCIYQTYGGKMRVIDDGLEYGVGDFTEAGIIFHIGDTSYWTQAEDNKRVLHKLESWPRPQAEATTTNLWSTSI